MEMEDGTARILNLMWDIGKGGPELAPAVAAPPGGTAPKLSGTVEGMGTPDPGAKQGGSEGR